MLTGLRPTCCGAAVNDPIAAAFAPVAMVIGLVAGRLARAGGWFRTPAQSDRQRVVITLALVAVPLRTALLAALNR